MFVLEPPYRVAQLLSSVRLSPIPIGAVVCAAGHDILESLVDLVVVLRADPWVAPSVIVPREELRFVRPLIESMPPLQDRVAPVVPPATQGRCPVAEVVAAVRLRPRPTGRVLAEYVTMRLQAPELFGALECQFREALQGAAAPTDRSVSTYCRLFQRYGRFTARDWRALARLACYLAQPQRLINNSQSRWVRYAHRYLGTSLYSAGALLGWEWVVEKALVRANYPLVASGERRCQMAKPSRREVTRSAGVAV